MDVPEVRALPKDLVFVDLETTGGNAAHHRIIEIGIVRVCDGEVIEEWNTLVNPDCVIPPYIESFTGISNDMVRPAPRFAHLAATVLDKLKPAGVSPVFVAHNARFDYGFLRAEFRRAELPFCVPVLCTVKLSRRLYPEELRHNLDAVMARHGLRCQARHRALGDAQVIRDLWLTLRRDLPEDTLAAAVQGVLGAVKLPPQLPEGLADELPDGAGIYRVFGDLPDTPGEALLYVGRAGSLRSGILAQLGEGGGADRVKGARALKEAARRIEWEETPGELGALLLEVEALRGVRPPYNRRAKDVGEATTLRVVDGAQAPAIALIDELEEGDLEDCFGLFHSAKDARKALADIARAHELCLKTLGLEEGDGSCLAHQLKRCRGACVGKEPLMLHSVRVRMALASLKLKPWPFPGRIALRERSAFGIEAVHVLDGWRYIGTAHSEDEIATLAELPSRAEFDAHLYKLLTRYFQKHPNLDWRALEAPPRLDSFDRDALDVF